MTVTAYCWRTKTADGCRGFVGSCAADKTVPMHSKIKIDGRWYYVNDRCKRGIDIWMPTRKGCLLWGRRQKIVHIDTKQKGK